MTTGRLRIGLGATLAGVAMIMAACSGGAPHLTFDGTSCEYSGSKDLSTGGVEMTFTNKSDEYAGIGILELPDDPETRASELALVGGDADVPPEPDPNAAQVIGQMLAGPGEEVTQDAPLPAGSFVVDCVTFSGDRPSHAWRAVALDVTD